MQKEMFEAQAKIEAGERMEKLIEKGNQLHDQAVFEVFARLVSMAMVSVRRRPGKNTRSGFSRGGKLSFQQTL